MSIIKSYSSLATEPFSSADFPVVKHFFPCNEATGTNLLTDVVGGVTIAFTGLTKPNANCVLSSSGAAQAMSGTWSTAATKHFVLFAVAEFDSASQFAVGNQGTGVGINLKTSSPTLVTSTATCTGTTFTLTTAATVYGRAMVLTAYNNASGLTTYQFDTNATATALASTATDATSTGLVALTTMPTLTLDSTAFRFSAAANLYGITWLEFTTLPSDLLVGLAWMTKEWSIGNKAIYPAWKDLS